MFVDRHRSVSQQFSDAMGSLGAGASPSDTLNLACDAGIAEREAVDEPASCRHFRGKRMSASVSRSETQTRTYR
jgi:hypothetical protein